MPGSATAALQRRYARLKSCPDEDRRCVLVSGVCNGDAITADPSPTFAEERATWFGMTTKAKVARVQQAAPCEE